MERKYFSVLLGMLLILALVLTTSMDIQKGDDFPEDVGKVIENSCIGCHSTGANAEDAVKALDFKRWSELKPAKKVGILSDIKEVVTEGTMPPGKVLKKYPEMALSEEDKKVILKWVKSETAELMD